MVKDRKGNILRAQFEGQFPVPFCAPAYTPACASAWNSHITHYLVKAFLKAPIKIQMLAAREKLVPFVCLFVCFHY
jgi:hypothetical protein